MLLPSSECKHSKNRLVLILRGEISGEISKDDGLKRQHYPPFFFPFHLKLNSGFILKPAEHVTAGGGRQPSEGFKLDS